MLETQGLERKDAFDIFRKIKTRKQCLEDNKTKMGTIKATLGLSMDNSLNIGELLDVNDLTESESLDEDNSDESDLSGDINN